MSTRVFGVWVKDYDGSYRWTNRRFPFHNGLQDPKNPEPLTWHQAKEVAGVLGCMDARVRELLPNKSPGNFFDQDPEGCPQCEKKHP
jgi:hypothetical protein